MLKEKIDSNEENVVDVPALLAELARRAIWIALATVIVGAMAAAFERYAKKPTYTASTSAYVLAAANGTSDFTTSDLQVGSLLTKDYEEVIKSRGVAESVIDDLKLESDGKKMEYEDFREKISVRVPSDTRVIYVYASDEDPVTAKEIANAVRVEAAKKIVDVMNVENVQTLDVAVTPKKPSNVNVKKALLIGAALGFVLSCFAFAVAYIMNDAIKTKDDVEKLLQISALAVIPKSSALETAKNARGKSAFATRSLERFARDRSGTARAEKPREITRPVMRRAAD